MAKFCRKCGKEMDDSALACPNCGAPTKTVKENKFPVWAIILIVFVGLIFAGGILGTSKDNTDDKPSGNTTAKEDLILEEDTKGYADDAGFAYYIEGYIKNTTNKDYNYVQVSFNVYDADGNTVGSCLANNSGLEANGRWKFKAICSGDADTIASYKLDEITKW